MGQFMAFSEAAARIENERMRTLLAVIRVGVNGNEKAYEKLAKTLD